MDLLEDSGSGADFYLKPAKDGTTYPKNVVAAAKKDGGLATLLVSIKKFTCRISVMSLKGKLFQIPGFEDLLDLDKRRIDVLCSLLESSLELFEEETRAFLCKLTGSEDPRDRPVTPAEEEEKAGRNGDRRGRA